MRVWWCAEAEIADPDLNGESCVDLWHVADSYDSPRPENPDCGWRLLLHPDVRQLPDRAFRAVAVEIENIVHGYGRHTNPVPNPTVAGHWAGRVLRVALKALIGAEPCPLRDQADGDNE